jgi:hypothetical protein
MNEKIEVEKMSATEIGTRIGKAVAIDVITEEGYATEWTGLDPQDADLLLAAGYEVGTKEWEEAESAAKSEYYKRLFSVGISNGKIKD